MPDTNEDPSKQETYIFVQAHLNVFHNASFPVDCSYYYITSLKFRRDVSCYECSRQSFCIQFGILHMPEYMNSAQCQGTTRTATKAVARFMRVKPIYIRKILLIHTIHETNDNRSDTESFNFL